MTSSDIKKEYYYMIVGIIVVAIILFLIYLYVHQKSGPNTPVPNPNPNGDIFASGNIIRLKSVSSGNYLGLTTATTVPTATVPATPYSVLDASKSIDDPTVFWTVVGAGTSFLLMNNATKNYLGNAQGKVFNSSTTLSCNPANYLVSDFSQVQGATFTPSANPDKSITIADNTLGHIGTGTSPLVSSSGGAVCYGYSHLANSNNSFTIEYFEQ